MSWLNRLGHYAGVGFKAARFGPAGIIPSLVAPNAVNELADKAGVNPFGGGAQKTQDVTYRPDPFTDQYRQDAMNAQRQGANTPGGLDPQTQAALDYYMKSNGIGATGLAALGGNSQAFAQFDNPFQQRVMDSMTPLFAQARQGAINDIKNQFTSPGGGAYGGSRQGVAEGVALGDIANQEAQTKAGLTYQGFNDAMQRAGQAAGYGFAGASGLSALGPYGQMMNDPELRKAFLMRQGMQGLPYGQTMSQPVNQNNAAGLAGWLALFGGMGG